MSWCPAFNFRVAP